MRRLLVTIHCGLIVAAAATMTFAQSASTSTHHAGMMQRGAEAMGFDQEMTTHHFRLTADGGIISVSANASDDVTNRNRIRMHLKSIAGEFARGDFSKPHTTHAEMPPGVSDLQRLKTRIRYTFTETPHGGEVRIKTADATALDAIHAFLRYQITEHRTGDPLSVSQVAASGFGAGRDRDD